MYYEFKRKESLNTLKERKDNCLYFYIVGNYRIANIYWRLSKFCEIDGNQNADIGDSLSGYSVTQFQYEFFMIKYLLRGRCS